MKWGVCKKVNFLNINKRRVLIRFDGLEKIKKSISVEETFIWHLKVRLLPRENLYVIAYLIINNWWWVILISQKLGEEMNCKTLTKLSRFSDTQVKSYILFSLFSAYIPRCYTILHSPRTHYHSLLGVPFILYLCIYVVSIHALIHIHIHFILFMRKEPFRVGINNKK